MSKDEKESPAVRGILSNSEAMRFYHRQPVEPIKADPNWGVW